VEGARGGSVAVVVEPASPQANRRAAAPLGRPGWAGERAAMLSAVRIGERLRLSKRRGEPNGEGAEATHRRGPSTPRRLRRRRQRAPSPRPARGRHSNTAFFPGLVVVSLVSEAIRDVRQGPAQDIVAMPSGASTFSRRTPRIYARHGLDGSVRDQVTGSSRTSCAVGSEVERMPSG